MMQRAKKQTPQAKRYSLNDLSLKKYMELDQAIKQLTKERDAIKEELKHRGTHSSTNYVCTVETRTRTNPPSLQALVERFGTSIREMCTVSEFQAVKVAKKGGE
jgi:histidinol-phosphate/aromatic aminotransferase/cobyric acid decarboxylase-like protein